MAAGHPRGQSEVVGTVLLLGITMLILGLLVGVGGQALDASEENMAIQSAEHAMNQLDTKTAMVALGRSDSQNVRMPNTKGGQYQVNGDSGWLRVRHLNHSGNGNVETIVNSTIGSAEYRNDGTTILYQAGGVWRIEESGGSTMVSPPDIHFRANTLTLPITKLNGEGGGKGQVTARVRQDATNKRIYPNTSAKYDGTTEKYQNPVTGGQINVTVNSPAYRAWADFFRTRTEGNVSTNSSAQTATIQLHVPIAVGEFNVPLEGNSLRLVGIEGHEVEDFSLTLVDDDSDEADFSNLKWSLYAEEGNQRFEIYIEDNSGGAKDGDPVRVIVYYTDSNGNTYQTWENDKAFHYEVENESENLDFNSDGDYDDKRLVLNFTSDINMTYEENAKPMVYSTSGDTFEDPTEFTGHEGEPTTYNATENESLDTVINHYVALMGPYVDLTVEDKESNTVNEEASIGTIDYDTKNKYLTYLHITENQVNVTFEGG